MLIDFRTPPSALTAETHYENIMTLFKEKGHFCTTIPELQDALKTSLKSVDKPNVINVMINPSADRKPQSFNWLTESKL